MDHKDYFKIGYFTKTRGLKGELQLFFDSFDPDSLDFDSFYVEIESKLVPFFVDSYRIQANQTGYFFIEDINHIDQAQELVHKRVFLPDSKKPTRDDEFSITDLKGFEVTDMNHGRLGVINNIDEYPQQYIATLLFRSKEVMFPLSEDFIREVDEEKKELYVHLPEGLIDIYLD